MRAEARQDGPVAAKGHFHPTFRPEIEGLRAVAVLPILFNHAHVRGFGGGFVGVDIFFVISGFLITMILTRDVAAGSFSIAQFYRRRVLRIFPALFAMLAAVTVMAAVAMTPNELVLYARSLVATIFFVSNIQFYADTGYFTTAAMSRPLLHTWSLAIEEQFYIFWPLLLAFGAGRSRRLLWLLLGGVVVASLAASVWMVVREPAAAFYLIPFRAWELGVGGLLALLPSSERLPRLVREGLAGLGLLTLLLCIRYYSDTMYFPGAAAIPPCLATCAIIYAGRSTLTGALLSIAPLRFFGRISYSLYLWHWPVIVFSALWLFLPNVDPKVIAGEIVVSILLAWLSYRLVEQGLRAPIAALRTGPLLRGAGAAMAAGALIAGGIVAANGFAGRYDAGRLAIAKVVDGDHEISYRRGSCFLIAAEDHFDPKRCLTPMGHGPRILILGDSTAAHLWPGFATTLSHYAVTQATMAGCPPQIADKSKDLPCLRFFDRTLRQAARDRTTDAVVLAGNWQSADADKIGATLAELRGWGLNVVLVGPLPRYDAALPRLLFFDSSQSGALAQQHLDSTIWPIDAKMREAAKKAGVTYFSAVEVLCSGGKCRNTDASGLPLQFDYVHLTTPGSTIVVSAMRPVIDRAINSKR